MATKHDHSSEARAWMAEHTLEVDGQRIELRAWPGSVELRKAAGDRPARIAGYAARWNDPTELWPGMFEEFAPGAFTESLRSSPDVVAFWDHDWHAPLGRTTVAKGEGSLRVGEDERGLWYEVEPLDTPAAATALRAVATGVVRGSSLGFRTLEERGENRDGKTTRVVLKATLVEVSPVVHPAYASTSAAVRSRPANLSAEAIAAELLAGGLTPDAAAAILDGARVALRARSGSTPQGDHSIAALERALEVLDD